MLIARFGFWLCFFGLATMALAAAPTLPISGQPMKFHRVRSADRGCEPNCPEWISADGQIVAGTAATFQAFVAKLGDRRLPILMTSPGGSVQDAQIMGRFIRQKHFATVVAGTYLTPCVATPRCEDSEGAPTVFSGACASACTILFAGGEARYAYPAARLGVHQSLTLYTQTRVYRQYRIEYRIVNGVKQEISRTEISETRKKTISKQAAAPAIESEVAAYFTEMGIGPSMTGLMEAAPPSGMHWMTAAEIESTRLVTYWIDKPAAFLSPDGTISGVAVTPTPDPALSKPSAPFIARGQWPFALMTHRRQIMLYGRFAYKSADDTVVATLETHFEDLALDRDRYHPPEVRGQGFTIRIEPDGGQYQVEKFAAGLPLSANVPRAAFCKLADNGQIVVEPFDGPPTDVSAYQATDNPHQPPISIAAASIDGMPDLLKAACDKAPASVAAKP